MYVCGCMYVCMYGRSWSTNGSLYVDDDDDDDDNDYMRDAAGM